MTRSLLNLSLSIFSLIAVTALSPPCFGSLKGDIGYIQLQTELGETLPLGSAAVFQVEAESPTGYWIANSADSQFTGKTITDLSSTGPAGISSHATNVGRLFYGNNSSLAPGVNTIGAHSVLSWLLDVVIPTGNYFNDSFTEIPLQTNRRVANHSWVGTGLNDNSGNYSPGLTASFLRHSDWLSDVDELIQVFGANNGSSDRVLMATAYNGITAGVTDTDHADGVIALDSTYTANRVAIHLVTPQGYTSSSAPTIASAATFLIHAASANPNWSESSTSNRLGTTIDNAERTETIKAVLMAGASRHTFNSTTFGDISDYREDSSNQTNNGLDWRYGAGQLNVYNSFHILAAGEKSSLEDSGASNIGFSGFDHDSAFGGTAGSNSVATYDLGSTGNKPVNFSISLVWNLRVFENSPGAAPFNETAQLYDINLELIDVTNGNSVIAFSASEIDNTENIWVTLEPYTHYQIRVIKAPAQTNFLWDYSLAWQQSATPLTTMVPLPEWTFIGLFSVLAASIYNIKKRQKN